jgi:hypothetical protein
VGTIGRFDEIQAQLRADLPDFLRRNIRGSSDSELFFHLILAGLHSRNQLEAAAPSDAVMLESIGDAARTIDKLVGDARSTTMLNMILCNGRAMYALRHGGAFGYVQRNDLRDPNEPAGERPRPGSPGLSYVMLVAGGQAVPAGFSAIAEGAVAIVNRDLEVRCHTL